MDPDNDPIIFYEKTFKLRQVQNKQCVCKIKKKTNFTFEIIKKKNIFLISWYFFIFNYMPFPADDPLEWGFSSNIKIIRNNCNVFI